MLLKKNIPLKFIFKMIKWDLLFISLFSIIVHLLSNYLSSLMLPIPIVTILGTTIALLLSFRLSQSYDRWWEARKIWSSIVNDSRTLVIQLLNLTTVSNDGSTRPLIKTIAYRQIGWCYSLSRSLRNQDPLEHLPPFISKNELQSLKGQRNIPMSLLNNHSLDIKEIHKNNRVNDFQQLQLDNTIIRLTASMGMAERIKNTIFPVSYSRTLHFLIYLFLILLSFSLTDLQSLLEIPVLILIAIPFFLLEKIALSIQDPFENQPTDTPTSSISRNIEINIKQLLNEKNIPEIIKPDTFYIL